MISPPTLNHASILHVSQISKSKSPTLKVQSHSAPQSTKPCHPKQFLSSSLLYHYSLLPQLTTPSRSAAGEILPLSARQAPGSCTQSILLTAPSSHAARLSLHHPFTWLLFLLAIPPSSSRSDWEGVRMPRIYSGAYPHSSIWRKRSSARQTIVWLLG